MSELGKYIAEHRASKNLSIRKLATIANISHTEVYRLENGERKNPSPLILKSIALALQLNYEDILKAAGYIDAMVTSNSSLRLSGIEELSDMEIKEVQDFINFLLNKKKRII